MHCFRCWTCTLSIAINVSYLIPSWEISLISSFIFNYQTNINQIDIRPSHHQLCFFYFSRLRNYTFVVRGRNCAVFMRKGPCLKVILVLIIIISVKRICTFILTEVGLHIWERLDQAHKNIIQKDGQDLE